MHPTAIATLDWPRIAADLDKEGYALLPALLNADQTATLRAHVRQTVPHAPQASLPGLIPQSATGWQATDALPPPVPTFLRALLAPLTPIARQWADRMGAPHLEPDPHVHCAVSKLMAGDYAPLRQHIHGAPAFPLQLVLLLSSPGADFTGGEFVLTEQRPRMQSRPMVLPLAAGDAALIAVAHRPMRGTRGDYQVNTSHAISRVRSGERLGIECLFHNPIGTATFGS